MYQYITHRICSSKKQITLNLKHQDCFFFFYKVFVLGITMQLDISAIVQHSNFLCSFFSFLSQSPFPLIAFFDLLPFSLLPPPCNSFDYLTTHYTDSVTLIPSTPIIKVNNWIGPWPHSPSASAVSQRDFNVGLWPHKRL